MLAPVILDSNKSRKHLRKKFTEKKSKLTESYAKQERAPEFNFERKNSIAIKFFAKIYFLNLDVFSVTIEFLTTKSGFPFAREKRFTVH